MTGYVPPIVQDYIDKLNARCLPYEVRQIPGKVTLICDTGRVHATAEFRQRAKGWYHNHAILTVDGQHCEIAHDFDELAYIISDPDTHLSVEKIRSSFPNGFTYCDNPPTVEQDVAPDDPEIPEFVKLTLHRLDRMRTAHPHATVRIEHPSRDAWQLRLSGMAQGDSDFVVMMVPSGGSWKVLRVVLTILPGAGDPALDLGTSIKDAFAGVGEMDKRGVTTGPVARAAQAPRGKNDTLAVRRNTVIRN